MNMRRTGTFDEFLKGEIAIWVPSIDSKQFRDLIKNCEKTHLKWANGGAPSAYIPYISPETPLVIYNTHSRLSFAVVMFGSTPIVKYENLSFKTPDTYELHISCRDGKTTHAIYKKNGEVVERSEARCCSGDTFNFTKGAAIAMNKLAAVQADTSTLMEILFPLDKGLIHRCKCSEE